MWKVDSGYASDFENLMYREIRDMLSTPPSENIRYKPIENFHATRSLLLLSMRTSCTWP